MQYIGNKPTAAVYKDVIDATSVMTSHSTCVSLNTSVSAIVDVDMFYDTSALWVFGGIFGHLLFHLGITRIKSNTPTQVAPSKRNIAQTSIYVAKLSRMSVPSVSYVVGWLCGCVVRWLCGCVVVWLGGCVVGWLGGCVVGWLCGWVVGWWGGCVVRWLGGCVVVWLGGWVVVWLCGWVVGWLGGWVFGCLGVWVVGGWVVM